MFNSESLTRSISQTVATAVRETLARNSVTRNETTYINILQNRHNNEDDFQININNESDIVSELSIMINLNLTVTEMAKRLHLSRPTIYSYIKKYKLRFKKYSDIADNELDNIIYKIKCEHSSAGQIIIQGHLRAKGIYIQRYRLRQSLHRVDREGTYERRHHAIRRRTYSVPGPNYLWHIDGTHKLIRWRLVVHAGIDGFSRLLTFVQCSNNNRAETVHKLVLQACKKYGYPLRIRTDEGGENVRIWDEMINLRPIGNPVIVGSSVHNQRIERMHRDLNQQVINKFYNLFHTMEESGFLNPDNATDLFCLHFVFIPVINKLLHEFIVAHNNHNISTEHNYTPLQLFILNQRQLYKDQSLDEGLSMSALDKNTLPYVNVPAITNPLTSKQFIDLKHLINPLHYHDAVEAFRDVAMYISRFL